MSQSISLCIFCREENAYLTKHTLNSALKCHPGTWSEIVVFDLFFQRRDRIDMPAVRFCRLESSETNFLKLAHEHTKGDWLFLLEAGEVVEAGFRPFGTNLGEEEKAEAYFIPLSDEDEDGWQPAFSPRLRPRSSLMSQSPEMQWGFLWEPFAVSRKSGPILCDSFSNFLIENTESIPSTAGIYLLAEKTARQGNPKKAADLFSRAYFASNDPRLKRFLTYKKTSCLFKVGQDHTALEQLLKGEKHFPSPIEFTYLKGKILLKLRRYRESLLLFEQAATMQKSPCPSLGPENFVITTGRAEALRALQQPEGSLDACSHALACCPGYYPALWVMAKTAFSYYPKSDAVRLLYRNTASLNKGKYAIITRILLDNDKIPEAFSCVKSGLKELPGSFELLFLKASCCLRQGQIVKSITILRKIPPDSSCFWEAFLAQCLCFWALKDYRRAMQILEAPGGQDAASEVREFCLYLHFYILHQERALAVQPFMPSLKKYNTLFLKILELAHYLTNREVFSVLVRLAMKRDQGNFSLNLAKLLAQKKEKELAVTFFNKAMKKGVYDSESLLIMGKIALEENLFPEARELFSLALKNFPHDANIYVVYAHTLLKEAALTLQDGLNQNPAHLALQKALKEVEDAGSFLNHLKPNL
jgi:tetratricopeptide (TPR) repeat protein